MNFTNLISDNLVLPVVAVLSVTVALIAEAGVSWTFGNNVGWKKIMDPVPYIEGNDRMTAYIIDREIEYDNLRRENSVNIELVGELKKILDIEGLLSKYSDLFDNLSGDFDGTGASISSNSNGIPKGKSGRTFNDYEGLRSLKERLRNAYGNGNNEDSDDIVGNNIADEFENGYADKFNDSAEPFNNMASDENGNNPSLDKDSNKEKNGKSGKKSGKNKGKVPKKSSKGKANKNRGNNGNPGKFNQGNLHRNGAGINRNGAGINSGNGNLNDYSDVIALLKDSLNSDADLSYLLAILDRSEPVGSPIFFFFELGTTDLVDVSQCVNLDEIARIAGKYDLLVNIEGAADSFTGNETINSELAINRAVYIADYFLDKGISAKNIYVSSIGGTDKYSPIEANRNTIITLYLK